MEQQSRRHQPVSLPIATPCGSSRQSDALVSGTASLRRRTAITDRLRNDDHGGLCAAAVVPRDESACGRALSRQYGALQYQTRNTRTRAGRIFRSGYELMFDSPFAKTKRLRHKGHIYRLKKETKAAQGLDAIDNLSLKKFAALPKTELLTGWNISPARG